MAAVLGLVAPIFGLILLGLVAARRGLIAEPGLRGLNDFVTRFATPALLFAGGTSGLAGGGRVAVAFFLGCLAVYATAVLAGRFALRQPLSEAALFGVNACFGNTVMLGLPIVLAAYGPAGLGHLLGIIAFHSLLILPVATALVELGRSESLAWGRVLRATADSVVRNPFVMALVAAGLWNATGLPLPGPARRFLEMLGAATPPLALFCLGAGLVGFGGLREVRETVLAGALKLVAMPLLVWLAARALDLPPLGEAVAVTTAALPTGIMAFLLARRHATGADRSAGTVLATTALSVVTLGAILAWYGAGG